MRSLLFASREEPASLQRTLAKLGLSDAQAVEWSANALLPWALGWSMVSHQPHLGEAARALFAALPKRQEYGATRRLADALFGASGATKIQLAQRQGALSKDAVPSRGVWQPEQPLLNQDEMSPCLDLGRSVERLLRRPARRETNPAYLGKAQTRVHNEIKVRGPRRLKQLKEAGGTDHGGVIRAEGDGGDVNRQRRAHTQERAEACVGSDAPREQDRTRLVATRGGDCLRDQHISDSLLE
jgi:hypothetical protein